MNIYTIYDSKAEAYIQPFFCKNNGVAIRLFQTAALDEQHDFHRHAADYTLFNIAMWDETKGIITQLENHINLGNAIAIQNMVTSKIQGE